MGHVIGIDLGTTQSCMAYMEGKEPQIIPNLEGLSTTPSVVSFTTAGEKLIGNIALRQASTNPEKTIYAVKRLMGQKYRSESIQEIKDKISYPIAEASNGDTVVHVDAQEISPQELSSMILGYLKKCAEAYFGESVTDTLITVPAHFDDHQRQATKASAQIAGLNVLRVINEPTAASLAYGLDKSDNATIAVYDMGGGTFDITIMEISNGLFNVLATNGNTFLGGEDFNYRVVQKILEEFQKEFSVDLSRDKLAMQRIREAVENAKCELSFKLETDINLPFIYSDRSGSKHLKKTLTRKQLEEMTKDLIDLSFPFVEQALSDSNLSLESIDDVILVGGQTRMPLIKERIAHFFGKKPVDRLNPEESVAMGAAIQSAAIGGEMKDLVLLLDVTPHSLGIEAEDKTFIKILEKNTTVPTSKTMAFTTVEDNQRRVKIHVLQGENEIIEKNTSLAVFDLIGIKPAPAGIPQIDVTFEIDANGLVRVSAKDVATGKKQLVEVTPSSGLTQDQIQDIMVKK
jgi:molecular chaperone DnaK